ncbi:hypothetical protein BRD15_07975 [Halobacteriales archaeon SW_6_65_15]|nr:MAG: hypothetical protein BRD15_07975 [Halobacteriales archaeon SW_6_65_15]
MTPTAEELPRVPSLRAGQTLLIAESGDLRRHAVDLRLLAARSDPAEGAAFVTTETGSKATLEAYESLDAEESSAVLGVVDAVSHDQNLPASYRETPVSHVAGPHDLARLSVAVGDLLGSSEREDRRRHLVVQSLTPLLETSDSDVVERFIRRTTHSAFVDGFSILRLDFTAHDERTLKRVRNLADVLLWVEESPDGALDFEVEQMSPSRTG